MVTYKELKDLANCGYENNNELPKGWMQYDKIYKNINSGFCGKIFIKNNEIVISYSGTNTKDGFKEFLKDGTNDFRIAVGVLPKWQLNNALQVYYNVINDSRLNNNYQLTITGHSLGGSLANLVGVLTGAKVVGFSTFAVGDLIKSDYQKYKNITNIGSTDDFIFMSNINKQVGKTKIFLGDRFDIYMPKFNLNPGFNHSLDNLGNDLDDAIDYKIGELESFYEKFDKNIKHGELKYVKKVSAIIYNNKDNLDEENGHWITIDGRHVFIETVRH